MRKIGSKLLLKAATYLLSFALAIGSFASYSTANAADPGVPKNLRIAKDAATGEDKITHNSVTIEWDYVEDFDNEIDIWNADDGAWLTWGNLQTRTIGGLTPETTYNVYITWNKDRPSHDFKSNILTFTTKEDSSEYPDPPLTPPQYVKVTGITETAVTLAWTGTDEANGYDLYVNGAWKGGVWDGSNTITFPIPKETAAGDSFKFEVGAQHAAEGQATQVSANSNAVVLTWGSLATPQDLMIVTSNRTTATLGWAPTPGAISYDIYKNGAKIDSVPSNRYTALDLTEGQPYTFHVVATNSLWESKPSDKVSVKPGSHYNIVTYYTSWSIYGRNFTPEDIDVSQITHINYAFSDLCWKGFGTGATACQNPNVPLQKEYVFDGEMVIGDQDADLVNFDSFAAIKADNPHLRVMISVGGWSWSKNFSNMAATEQTRRAFANSVVKFLRAYQLDGLDVDWEYPVEGGESYNSRSPEDKDNFTLLMQTVRAALDAASSEDGRYYLLTIASGQGDNFVVNADLAKSSKYLDFINIMTYDYSGSWDETAYHNAPLYYDSNSPSPNAQRFHVDGGVSGHLNGGVPAYKLQLGLPFYGKGWLGCPPNGQYQLCKGGELEGFGTWESRTFDFSDVEGNYVNKNGYVRYWNDAAKVPYLYNSELKTYISYNDKESIMNSTSYVKSKDLAGVMSWEISGDRNRTLSTQLAKDLPIGRKTIPLADQAITRAEFAAQVMKALNIAPGTDESPFKDVIGRTRFAGEIHAAAKLGLVKGKSANKFDPTGVLTRQEMAVIIVNALKHAGANVEVNLNVLDSYSDQAKIAAWAKASMALMVEKQMMGGVSPTRLDPLSKVTKGQTSDIINKLQQAIMSLPIE